MRKLYHIHRVYEDKRQRIQKLSKHKPETSRRLLLKYSGRERNRARDSIHKLTTKIAEKLSKSRSGAIMERLKGIKRNILNRSKEQDGRLSKWNARDFQSMLEYKLKWLGLPVKYVNARNTSKICPLCSGSMASYGAG